MMKYFKFLAVIVFSFCFLQAEAGFLDELSGAKVNFNFSFGGKKVELNSITFGLISDDGTEADFSFDKSQSEFCCDREYTYENFFDMSEAESERIVQSVLGSGADYIPTPRPASSEGQR